MDKVLQNTYKGQLMTTTPQRDYVELGAGKLLHQFSGKPNIEGVLAAYTAELNKSQQGIMHILDERGLSSATGAFLDDIGKLVGVQRLGDTDEDYRSNIDVGILLDISEGTPNDLLRIVKKLTVSSDVKYFEHYPCFVHLQVNGEENLERCYKIAKGAIPVGVDVGISIKPLNKDLYTPSELVKVSVSLTEMVDDSGNNIIDNFGDNIQVTTPSNFDTSKSRFSELPEYGGTKSNALSELYDRNR